MKPVRKAVFPVAGLGTRFLPATKAIPKEMLTVLDRPLIQYAVEEAREAGIEQMIFVTGRGKGALEDHFDIGYELEGRIEIVDQRGFSAAGHEDHLLDSSFASLVDRILDKRPVHDRQQLLRDGLGCRQQSGT